ncbi:MAG: hypothetical protein ACJ8AG_04285, partial [Ktedonobacteraceae bacterium]
MITFKVYDRQGKEVARIERHVTQSRETLPPTGGSTGTAAIVKEIKLDVSHLGTPRKVTLIPESTTLPWSQEYTFYHPGDTDYIRLPLYQNSRPIEVIKISKCWQPKGTEIKLTVAVDKLSHFTIKGMIGDSPIIDLAVELPEDQALPSDEEVRALNLAFQNAIVYLPGGKRAVIEAQYRRAKQSYEAALKRKDQQQAIHEFEQMEDLVASISHSASSLEPPKEKFDELVSTCHELNRDVRQSSYNLEQPYDYKEMAKTIEAQQVQGDRAFEARDQPTYSDAIEMLESIHNHLISLYLKAIKFIDRRTETEKAIDYLQFATQEAAKLEQRAARSGSKEQLDEIRQIKQELHHLEQNVSHNPQDAEFRVNQTRRKLEQINNILASSQNQSDIKGLVEDWKDGR